MEVVYVMHLLLETSFKPTAVYTKYTRLPIIENL